MEYVAKLEPVGNPAVFDNTINLCRGTSLQVPQTLSFLHFIIDIGYSESNFKIFICFMKKQEIQT